MSEARIEARKLGYAVRGKPLLRDVSLHFHAGSYTAIVGPNGAGKSTLLRLLCGALRPTAGEVLLEGTRLDRIPRVRIARRLSYLPQDSSTRFDVTVWDAVAMGRFSHRRSWQTMSATDLEVIADAIERVDLAVLARRTLPTLSGGEMQRVFLARALAQEAEVLVLDEPTNSLDVRHQLELMALLAGLHAEGKTIVLAMHDLEHVWESIPSVVLLHEGCVVAEGPAREALLSPAAAEAFGVRIEETATGIRCLRP